MARHMHSPGNVVTCVLQVSTDAQTCVRLDGPSPQMRKAIVIINTHKERFP